jgi:wobble nucleotide-excising tRNase
MGILEESKVVQVINRLESTRELLNEVNAVDSRFNEKISQMTKKLTEYEKDLAEIKKQLNIENLGVKEQPR